MVDYIADARKIDRLPKICENLDDVSAAEENKDFRDIPGKRKRGYGLVVMPMLI